jgi:hypothetical protein
MPAELTRQDQQRVSHYLIFRDLRFAHTMLLSIVRREGTGESMSWLTLTYLHYLSLVAYEVRKYSQRNDPIPGADTPLRFEPSLSESRHSTKLFDDTAKSVEDLLSEFFGYAEGHREWFIGSTTAPSLVRSSEFLQKLVNDTSVHLYDGRIVSTSHSIRYHAGLDMHLSGEEVSARAQELAYYLTLLTGAQGDAWAKDETFADSWDLSLSTPMDTKFASFYGSTFADFALSESMALTMLSCQVNTAILLGHLSRHIAIARCLAFKFRFASIWQVLATLRKISVTDSPFGFAPSQRGELTSMLSTAGPMYLFGQGARKLRNTMVHYGARDLALSDLIWNDPFLGLPQKFCDGQGWSDLDILIEQCAKSIQQLLDAWRGPFAQLLNEPCLISHDYKAIFKSSLSNPVMRGADVKQ